MPRRVRLRQWSLVAALLIAFLLPVLPAGIVGMSGGEAMAHATDDHGGVPAHAGCCPAVCQALQALPAETGEVTPAFAPGGFFWRPEGAPPGVAAAGPEPPPPRLSFVM